ncbi:hypothetical protein [Aquibacillus kalidii]|uniref:hypothetical protein n=1 Tax=Aquibacillus kalidii TaxID=2762597 RepID=UPI001648DE76|nr:hypothetical protein [Aquibacillus kalidii]
MKWIRRLTIAAIIIGGLLYAIYHFGTEYIASKVVEEMDVQLTSIEAREEIQRYLDNSPELKQFVEEGASLSDESLPFTTKEEAVKKVVTKLNVTEIQEIQAMVENGVSTEEQQILLKKVEDKLSSDELDALKVVIYKELYQ